VRPTPLYIGSEVVIPAKAGIQIENTGFRVKPGMTGGKGIGDNGRKKAGYNLPAFKIFNPF
jgi:hypothetical protein